MLSLFALRLTSKRLLGICLLLSSTLLTGCHTETEADVIERDTVPLRGEQVMMNADQARCGEKAGLWTIEQIDGGGARGRLQGDGRSLFSDDILMGDRRYRGPVGQLAADYKVKVGKIKDVTNEGPSSKIVTAEIGVIIPNGCFDTPLPLLGIEKGDFSEEALPRIRLREHNGWSVDAVVH